MPATARSGLPLAAVPAAFALVAFPEFRSCHSPWPPPWAPWPPWGPPDPPPGRPPPLDRSRSSDRPGAETSRPSEPRPCSGPLSSPPTERFSSACSAARPADGRFSGRSGMRRAGKPRPQRNFPPGARLGSGGGAGAGSSRTGIDSQTRPPWLARARRPALGPPWPEWGRSGGAGRIFFGLRREDIQGLMAGERIRWGWRPGHGIDNEIDLFPQELGRAFFQRTKSESSILCASGSCLEIRCPARARFRPASPDGRVAKANHRRHRP